VNRIDDVKARAQVVLLRYRLRLFFVTGTLVWIGFLRLIILFLTPLTRTLLIYSFGFFFLGFVLSFTQLFSGPITFSLGTYLYNRKNPPEETDFPELYDVAKQMEYPYNKKIRVTDNPDVDSAYTNMNTGEITFPRNYREKYSLEEILSILAHEVAHLKTRKKSYFDMGWVMGGTVLAALGLAMVLPTIFAQIGAFAVFYLLLVVALQRNEYRADEEAAKILGPDHLISVFRGFARDKRYAGGSESHPAPKKRIARLRRLFSHDERKKAKGTSD